MLLSNGKRQAPNSPQLKSQCFFFLLLFFKIIIISRCCRSRLDQVVSFPVIEFTATNNICKTTLCPAEISADMRARAQVPPHLHPSQSHFF